MKQFTLFWKDGRRTVETGRSIERVLVDLGCVDSVYQVLYHYVQGNNEDFIWVKKKQQWEYFRPLSFDDFDTEGKKWKFKVFVIKDHQDRPECVHTTRDKTDSRIIRFVKEAMENSWGVHLTAEPFIPKP